MAWHRACRRAGAAIALVAALATAACGGGGDAVRADAPVPSHPPWAGELLSARELGRTSLEDTRRLLRDGGLDDAVSTGVTAYLLTYETVGARGGLTTATGLLAVPSRASGPLSTVLYAHGSVLADDEAPSRLQTREGAPLAAAFAGSGFLYVAPDYLGLGSGPGDHPYLDARTEATASRDLIEAAHEFAGRRDLPLAPDLYVTGFSQGGQAAVALAELLTAHPLDGTRLRAVAPIAGPHDLSGVMWRTLVSADRPADGSATLLLALLLASWQRTYQLFPGQEVFQPAVAASAAALLDGRTGFEDARAQMPATLPELIAPAVLRQLRDPRGRLAAALRANDGCSVAPAAPVRIYQGAADGLVPRENALRCEQRIRADGGTAEVVDLGDVGHGESLQAALPSVLSWFGELRDR